MNNELWGIGRTFLLCGLALVGTIVLIAIDKIPKMISVGDWTGLLLAIIGAYTVKTVGHVIAKTKKKD